MDVKSAFLHGYLHEEIYMKYIKGYITNPYLVCVASAAYFPKFLKKFGPSLLILLKTILFPLCYTVGARTLKVRNFGNSTILM